MWAKLVHPGCLEPSRILSLVLLILLIHLEFPHQCFPHSLSHFSLGLSSIARDVVELTIGQPQISPGANLSTQTSGAIRVTWKILISWSLMFWFKKKAKIRTMYKAIYFLRFRVCLKIYYTLPSSVKKKDILHYLASQYLFPFN